MEVRRDRNFRFYFATKILLPNYPDSSSFWNNLESIYAKGRDNARTPFQWNDETNGGFTSGEPWLKVNPNYRAINGEAAIADDISIFHYYRRLIQLRKQYPIIVYGDYTLLLPDDDNIYAYLRSYQGEKLLVITNFSEASVPFTMPADFQMKERLIGNYPIETEEATTFTLKPYEARVYKGV